MKDCGYISESPKPCCPSDITSEEEQYPEFSLWGPDAVRAVFGAMKLEAGTEYDLPARIRVKSVSVDEKRGTNDVRVCIVAVGKIKKLGKGAPEPDDSEDEYEEGDEEEA